MTKKIARAIDVMLIYYGLILCVMGLWYMIRETAELIKSYTKELNVQKPRLSR